MMRGGLGWLGHMAHNHEIVGSNPTPATTKWIALTVLVAILVLSCASILPVITSGTIRDIRGTTLTVGYEVVACDAIVAGDDVIKVGNYVTVRRGLQFDDYLQCYVFTD